ncbi:MAG: HAMP domain-containing protein [Deltaproteobacteria bacterium]|nr:MAG: HAMP domain-containing protein [Deltaproteobacteria bacterium]
MPMTATPARAATVVGESGGPFPLWLPLLIVVVLAVHLLAGATTQFTINLMRSLSPFAQESRAFEMTILPYWRLIAYVTGTIAIFTYLWPVVVHFRRPVEPVPTRVQRRVLSAPFLVAAMTFAPWCLSAVFFPAVTLWRFGRWAPELMSQQVLSPVVNGFLAATTSYLVLEWLFRSQIVPRVFPDGRIPELGPCLTAGVRTRLFLFLAAVAFIPLFTMLGVVRTGVVRVATRVQDADTVVAAMAHASTLTFFLYVALGIVLTLILARSLTRPLGEVAGALRRVQRGDLGVQVRVGSSDEVGVLEDGVNALVGALRDREHILQTFGHVVDPSVRDYLLAGGMERGGELRAVTVLFCDLRGFTTMAERMAPEEVVRTLNEFFATMTAWVRQCGGFVDKFIGDAMLVVFGLFETSTAERPAAGAAAALRCALGMEARLAELNRVRVAAGREPLETSIAVHAGEVVAGAIGAPDRHEFTVIGDTVNVAARLQELCRETGCTLLVSETAYELARRGGVEGTLAMREPVHVRGRSRPIGVFGPEAETHATGRTPFVSSTRA